MTFTFEKLEVCQTSDSLIDAAAALTHDFHRGCAFDQQPSGRPDHNALL